METKRINKKICLLGDPAVGKTSLIHRYVYEAFDDKYLSTIGAKITKKTSVVEMPEADMSVEINLMIWDIAGQKMFGNVQPTYFRGAKGAMIVADITRRETFNNLVSWIWELFQVSPGVPVLILVNKYDLMEKAEISKKEIDSIITKLGASYLFTSAKTGENVENAFKGISQFMAKQAAAGK